MESPGSGSGSGGAGGGATLEMVEFSVLPPPVGRTARRRAGATVNDLQPWAPNNPALNPTQHPAWGFPLCRPRTGGSGSQTP